MTKDKQLITFGYNHLEPGHPNNPKTYRICGSHTTSENSQGDYCLLPAGMKTKHVGVGRCYLHGGRNEAGPLAPRYSSGRYSHVFKGRLQQHFENIGNDDSNPLDLVPELQVQRVMLSLALDKLDESPLQPGVNRSDVNQIVGHVGNDDADVVSDDDMVGGGGVVGSVDNSGWLDIPRVEFSGSGAPDSSIERDKRVAGAKMRLVRTEDVELVRELSADIVNTVTKIIATRNQTALTKADITYLLATMREAIEMFVEKDKREAFVKYLLERIPIVKAEEGGIDVA